MKYQPLAFRATCAPACHVWLQRTRHCEAASGECHFTLRALRGCTRRTGGHWSMRNQVKCLASFSSLLIIVRSEERAADDGRADQRHLRNDYTLMLSHCSSRTSASTEIMHQKGSRNIFFISTDLVNPMYTFFCMRKKKNSVELKVKGYAQPYPSCDLNSIFWALINTLTTD